MTIATIIGALTALIANWKAPINLTNDLDDAVLALSTVEGIVPGTPLLGAGLAIVQKAEADYADLQAGQAATVATREVDGKTYSLIIVENTGSAGQALGL